MSINLDSVDIGDSLGSRLARPMTVLSNKERVADRRVSRHAPSAPCLRMAARDVSTEREDHRMHEKMHQDVIEES
jgi:hypothetical protein